MSTKITYTPWSQEVLRNCLNAHDNGLLPTLDLDLTAKCSAVSCIYCDSRPDVGNRHPNELNVRETMRLIEEASKGGLKWIYTCGLGEPMEDSRFTQLVNNTKKMGYRISMFTNGIFINKSNAKWLFDNNVGLILKLDSFNEENFDKILGKKGQAAKIYEAVNHLLNAGYGSINNNNGMTDLAFSIVPTKVNLNDITEVIRFAKKNNIFPSVGELEQAGRVLEEKSFNDLSTSEQQMKELKQIVEKELWKDYCRPICPTIITGLHIDNIGNCVTDSDTGLNCKWFMLSEPAIQIIGNIRKNTLEELYLKARSYRLSCFTKNSTKIEECQNVKYLFGGCGGNPNEIIKIARNHLQNK